MSSPASTSKPGVQGSGVEADVRFFAQFKVREGKVVYIYDHDDRAEALQAAGLRE
jgi:hypothetical protein